MPEDIGGPKGLRTRRPILVDRSRALRRRSRRARGRGNGRAGARCGRTVRDRLRAAPRRGAISRMRSSRARRMSGTNAPAMSSFTLVYGDEKATDSGLRQGSASRLAAARQQSPRPERDGGPRRHRRLRPRRRQLHAPHQLAGAARGALAARVVMYSTLPETKFRVIAPDVGGGFGVKADAYPEDALVLWASRRCGRPVKWVATRTDTHGGRQSWPRSGRATPSSRVDASRKNPRHPHACAARGRLLHRIGGCRAADVFAALQRRASYDIQTLWLTTKAVFTHTSPLGVYRGAGRPEGNYVIERLLDRAALTVGIGPDEIRRRNFIKPAAMPYATPTGSVYDSGEFERLMNECMRLARLAGLCGAAARIEARGQSPRTFGVDLYRARRHFQRDAWASASMPAAR